MVLSKQEEAHYVSRGITLNVPDMSGIVADLGGGSLEVVAISKGVVKHSVSFDFGHLSEIEEAEIDAAFSTTPWMKIDHPGRLYGVGGSFRALGSAYIEQSGYPLAVLHGLNIPAATAGHMLSAFTRNLPDMTGVPIGRQQNMPCAARIMKCLCVILLLKRFLSAAQVFAMAFLLKPSLTTPKSRFFAGGVF